MQDEGNIVFLDLESTALPSESNSKILEVGILITNQDFIEIERKEWCISTPKRELKLLSAWHRQHFKSVEMGGNGLFDDVEMNGLPLSTVTEQVLAMLSRHCPAKKCKLAGFSVHCDRELLYRQMPAVYSYMSHQILDVSTLLSAATIWAPQRKLLDIPFPNKGAEHRAMQDVLRSMECLKFLTEEFFQRSATVPRPVYKSTNKLPSRAQSVGFGERSPKSSVPRPVYGGYTNNLTREPSLSFGERSQKSSAVGNLRVQRITAATSAKEPLSATKKQEVWAKCGKEPPHHCWFGHESEVTIDNCEMYGMNDYIYEKYGMMMGLDHCYDSDY